MYTDELKRLLSPLERRIFARLTSPQKIQDFLDTLSINFEKSGETYMSPRRTLKTKTAHCFEGALVAAVALAYHGEKPLLMDLRTEPDDEDHVVALFRRNGLWGAMSKTNHATLRYRDPVYRSPRELAMSYFHEYIDKRGRKTLREYSAPFDLRKYETDSWLTAEFELVSLVNDLDDSRHFPIVPKKNLRSLRRATQFEIRTMDATEWRARDNSTG
ncbi:MAG: hypothetical protein WC050_00120 [Candidatus Paceibacterota bacterium]